MDEKLGEMRRPKRLTPGISTALMWQVLVQSAGRFADLKTGIG